MPLKPMLAALLAAMLSGCTIFGGPADRALRRTPSYRDGYQDGCAAATNSHTDVRGGPVASDNSQYRTDHVYRTGWGNGYQACRGTLVPGVNANAPNGVTFPDP